MTFTKDSALVQIWVRLVLHGTYDRDNVPKLYNLQEMVYLVLDEIDEEKEKGVN